VLGESIISPSDGDMICMGAPTRYAGGGVWTLALDSSLAL